MSETAFSSSPDLVLTIEPKEAGTSHAKLVFSLSARDPTEGLNDLEGETAFDIDSPQTREQLQALVDEIETPRGATTEETLSEVGKTLWRLVPVPIQEALWDQREGGKTLLLQTKDLWAPWEILRLVRPPSRGNPETGPFLAEAFAVSRWLRGTPHCLNLPWQEVGLVVPSDSSLPWAPEECAHLLTLDVAPRSVRRVDARRQPVLNSLAAGDFDGWHFTGHGLPGKRGDGQPPICLEGNEELKPRSVENEAQGLGQRHPLVFFNGCTTGQQGVTLTGAGGWAHAFLKVGAGAFLGAHWRIVDRTSFEFAAAFYRHFLAGAPFAEAVRQARLEVKDKGSTWLAYVAYGHPLATATRNAAQPRPAQGPLVLPRRVWTRAMPPAALLHTDYGIVDFHGREREINDLKGWCDSPEPLAVKLFTGAGGMGKTRLAFELAQQQRKAGWIAGFIPLDPLPDPDQLFRRTAARPGAKVLMVLDYAETHRELLVPLLQRLVTGAPSKVRLVLLARAALDWWEMLKQERHGVGDFLAGSVPRPDRLAQLAATEALRRESHQVAARAFARHLGRDATVPPPRDLAAKHFERVLVLHMFALLSVEQDGGEEAEDAILDRVLAREKRFWHEFLKGRQLPPVLAAGVSRALAAITLAGGISNEANALELLRQLRLLADQPALHLHAIVQLLRDAYPGEGKTWVAPLQPDILGEHLVQRELEAGADELLDLVLGPRSSEAP